MEVIDRLKELKQQGFFCSQILLIMGLELQGSTNPELVRTMNGLVGGLGFSGEICGALTGGACLMGLYAGKGTPEEPYNLCLDSMIQDLVQWFKTEYIPRYKGIRCEEILEGNPENRPVRCPILVSETFQKVKEMLVENGYDLSGIEV
ncbi:MAG: C_GCAxxG_C_C family protein [Anaerolineales bacterium]|nr:C_GCAxxG_C_C family protein [Anaerolineales bacterium]